MLEKKEYIKSNIAEVLKDKSITIEANFLEKIKVTLFDRGEKIYQIESENTSMLRSCPIRMNINYLTTSAKATFTRRMKIEPVNYGNIFIYKNNFRVMPYGEKDYDTFGLNLRKTQGYSRYLATRELLGFIDIKDKNNKYFKEASSRDSGFINNIYLSALQDLYMDYLHRPLEAYIGLVSWGEFEVDKNSKEIQVVYFEDADIDETEKFKKYISRKKQLTYFKNTLSFEENKPGKKLEKIIRKVSSDEKIIVEPLVQEVKKQVEKLKSASREQEKLVIEKNKSISNLENQNKNLIKKRSESSYGEQLSHHLTTFTDRLDWVVQDLQSLSGNISPEYAPNLYETIQTIQRTKNELAIFKDILLNTDFDTRAKFSYNLHEILEWYILEKKKVLSSLTILIVGDGVFNITCNIVELTLMLDNFYNNAYEHGASFIQFEFKNTHELFVSSNSHEIEEENYDKIFELGFSTKASGTGIGLNQIKTFLNKSGFSINISRECEIVTFVVFKD